MIHKMGKNDEEGVLQFINPQRMLGGILLDNIILQKLVWKFILLLLAFLSHQHIQQLY